VANVKFEPVQYPKAINIPASKVITPLGKLAVYEGSVKLRVPFRILKTADGGNYVVHLDLQTQACNAVSCFIPQDKKLTVTIHVSAPESGRHITPAPKVASNGGQGTTGELTTSGTAVGQRSGQIARTAAASLAQQLAYIRDHPYAPANHMNIPLWALVLFAFVGGLILNVMPCVLPVIPIKVMAMVEQAHGSRQKALRHAMAFTIGVLTLFMAIALVLGVQKLTGDKLYFYGEQFQNPFFVVSLVVVVALAGLSMLGVWTVNLPQAVYTAGPKSSGYAGSFFTGLLATVLATPCSAPFLGVMITWALGRPIIITILFFALVGVGMAAPYLILALFPGAIAKVPRAGRWSELLKQGLGIITIGVAVYLLGTLHDRHEILIGAFVTLSFCLGAWIWGQWPIYGMSEARVWTIRTTAVAVSVLATAGTVWFLSGGTPVSQPPTAASQPLNDGATAVAQSSFAINHWQPFTIFRMKAALKKGHPVVVDFTANWCVNCKFVKATVLESPAVRTNFSQAAVVLLRADLTKQNPVAQSLLVKLGGRSIPFLAIFSPRSPYRPEVLRDIYSIGDVTQALQNTKG
jgi:thiol:disulfide interchange protein DsbD